MSGTIPEPAEVADATSAIRAESNSNLTTSGPQDRSPSPTVLESNHEKQQKIEKIEDSDRLRVKHVERPETTETAMSGLTAETIHEISDVEQTRDTRLNRRSVLDTLTLPPPPAYDLFIKEFSIGVPPPTKYLPLPVPIPAPRIFSRNENNDYSTQTIIRDINVRCGSGEVLAIIGGSGSGKSTLLNAIVGRIGNLPVRGGELSFAPTSLSTSEYHTLSARGMKDKIGFVPQNDYLHANLTVRETLHYAAALRLPAAVNSTTRRSIVNQTLDELGLTDVADTVIGGFGGLRKGISGGERRRVSIACILVALPSVIVLDEPTSGLDAFTAYQLLLTLSELAKRNRTIILSLHQPRSDAFGLFTRLLLLSKGSVVYSGLTSKCLPWFSSLGFNPEKGVNPLDFLIDISSVDPGDAGDDQKREASLARVGRLVNAWKTDGDAYSIEKSQRWSRRLLNEPASKEKGEDFADKALKKFLNSTTDDAALRRPGLIKQTITLTSRANKNTLRDYGQLLGFTAQSVIIGVMLGVSYYQLPENPTGIQSLKTLCFQHMAAYFYLTIIYSIYRYCTELVVFDRERSDNLYKVIPWMISEIIANLSLNAFFPSLFVVIMYFMVGLRTDDLAKNLFILIAECILLQLGSTAFALFSTSLVRNFAEASLMANGTSIFLFLTAGYALLKPPDYVNWIRFISIFWYGFRIVAISQFKGRVFSCEGITGNLANQCLGDQVLNGLFIPLEDSLAQYFGPLVGVVFGFYALDTFILMVWKPGGVTHAAKVGSTDGKEKLPESDMDIIREKVNVEIRGVGLSWIRPHRLIFPRKEKRILNNITFSCPAGQITGIMGPSGAGKSSILQLLAARTMNPGPFAHFRSEGSILINGRPLSRHNNDAVSYVAQEDDYHLPALTVRETIRYAAILRLPSTMSKRTKLSRAEEIIRMLGLEDCADNLVGGPLLKGISGGEKRRLSLAVEMLNDPAVLIVDEVTSGLDSATANNVMHCLKSIAESGRTVIDIYKLLDNVVVLAKGGNIVYAGPRSNVETVLEAQGFKMPKYFNPADFLLDIVSIDYRPEYLEQTRKQVDNIIKYWAENGGNGTSSKEKAAGSGQTSGGEEPTARSPNRLTPMWVAGPVVLERTLRNMWRQQPVFWVRIQQTPLMSALFLLFFQRLVTKPPAGGQNTIGLLQQLIGALPYVGLLNSVAIFPAERDLFFHEYHSSAAYSTATFTLVTSIVEVPFTLVANLLAALLMNLVSGLTSSPRIYFEFALSTFAVQNMGESIGIIFSALTSSMGLSVALVSSVLSCMMQFAGLVSLAVPKWLQVLSWISTVKPASRILVINEASGFHLDCSPESVQNGECLIQTGDDLIQLFGWKDLDTGKFLGIMLAICVIWRLLGWITLMIKLRGW